MLIWRTTDPGSCFRRTKDFWALAHVFRGPKVLDLGSCFQRPRIFGSWLMFSKDQGFFGALVHVFRGSKVLDPGSYFQRPRIFESWLMFSEDQRFWILSHVFRDLGFLDLGSCF